jgi:hypothetical protein
MRRSKWDGRSGQVGLDGLADALGNIELARFDVALRAVSTARLPRFLGSTLRGGLARSTRRVACALRREECPSCLLRERCAYAYLFETFRPHGSDRLRGQGQIPHPLVLTVPEPRDEPYGEGEELRFGITLFGRSLDYLPHLVVALGDMAARGLGRRLHRFEVASVETAPMKGRSQPIFEPGAPLASVQRESLASHLGRLKPEDRVTMDLLTPTRLTDDGQLTCSPGLEVFVRSLAQRALAMLHFHGGLDLDLDIEGLTAAARDSRVVSSDLRLVRLQRWSSRQRSRVPLDGMVGTIRFEGEPVRDLWPLLLAGEVLRVGKGTVFGLGRYKVLSDRRRRVRLHEDSTAGGTRR